MWELNFLTRDQTHVPAVEVWIPNHWATREFQRFSFERRFMKDSGQYRFLITKIN